MPNTASLNVKALKAVGLFASTEETRYYLKGVLVTVAPRFALYVATDGHRMLCHREDLAEGAEDNTLLGKWIVPSEAIAAIKGGSGRFQDAPATMTEIGEGELRIAAPKGDVIAKPIDGTFPDWHRVVPPAHDEKMINQNPQFNGLYVVSFAKAADLLGYGNQAPHFHCAGAGDPTPVSFGEGRPTFGVIMPVRNPANLWAGIPDWVRTETPTAEMLQAAE